MAQLVERCVRDAEVAGSRPVIPTAEWTGEVPASPHKACNVGSNPTSAIYAGVVLAVSTSACQAGSTGSNPVTCSNMPR